MIRLFYRNSSLTLLIFLTINSSAQRQDRIWLFADSSGIDFNNLQSPLAINSNIANPCYTAFTSIADYSGNLLFYAAGVELTDQAIRVFDKNGNIMQNGDSVMGYPTVGQACLIIPFPSDSTKFYLFTSDRNSGTGNYIYYSIVNINMNNGLGDVTSKNNLLLNDFVNEKLTATRHANGRDWWLILQSSLTDQLFHKFLITPNGISSPSDQYIGSSNNPNKFFGQMIFSPDGNKLALVSPWAYVDIYDFDRCTGELSNYINAGEQVFTEHNGYFGCSFSANGQVLYVSPIYYSSKNIYQYDLTSSNVKGTKQIIYSYPDTGAFQYLQLGEHKLGPDGKIYLAKGNGFTGINSDTYYTHHIDVILNPDQLGVSCNLSLANFDLGNGRTISGLPNMPNYNLGPVVGSICDSLTNGIK